MPQTDKRATKAIRGIREIQVPKDPKGIKVPKEILALQVKLA